MSRAALCLLALLLPLWLSAGAQTVHKCGAGATPTYSDMPCHDAKALKLDRGKSDTDSTLEQDKKELKRLERQRHRRQAQEDKEQQRAARAATSLGKKCARLERERRWAEDDARAAAGKRVPRARLKAERAAQEHEETCSRREGLRIGTGN